jgi:hypothetical protein
MPPHGSWVKGVAMADDLIAPFVDSLTPLECTQKVVQLMKGENPFPQSHKDKNRQGFNP